VDYIGGLNDVVSIKIDCSENGCKHDHPYMKQNIKIQRLLQEIT